MQAQDGGVPTRGAAEIDMMLADAKWYGVARKEGHHNEQAAVISAIDAECVEIRHLAARAAKQARRAGEDTK
jgi:hypothetical protein